MSFDLGDAYPAALDVFDASGNYTNATSVTLTITLPDGTTTSPTVSNPPSVTGQYRVTYVPVQSGRHMVRWVTTAPNTGYTDAFDVSEANPDSIMPLAVIKGLLGIDLTDVSDDEAIRDMLVAVTSALEDYKNQVIVQRTFTERYSLSGSGAYYWTMSGRLRLMNTPVISITSITSEVGGITWNPANLYVEPASGIVTTITGPAITGRVIVTYVAGMQVIPRRYLEAAKTLFQHLWEARRGPGGTSGVIGAEELGDYRHFTGMPRKVTEMMGPPQPVVA